MQTGKRFEKEMIKAYRWGFKTYCNSSTVPEEFMVESSSVDDIKEGTDLCDGEIHIDFTLNFDGKDHMKTVFPKTVKISRWFPEIHYGVRTGNSYHSATSASKEHLFQTPVVVVGVTMLPEEFRKHYDEFMDAIYEHIYDIMATTEDVYYEFKNEHPEMFQD